MLLEVTSIPLMNMKGKDTGEPLLTEINKLREENTLLKQKLAQMEQEQQVLHSTRASLNEKEEKLKEDYLLLRTLVDHIPSSIFVLDKNYRKTIINKAHLLRVADTTGIGDALTEQDLLGKTNYDIYPKIVADEYQQEDRQVIEEGRTIINREELSLSMFGEEIWEQISKIPMKNEKGEIIGMVGIALNTTRIKKAEQKIDNIDHLLSITGELAQVGGWEIEVPPFKSAWTKEAAQVLGITYNEEIDQNLVYESFEPESVKLITEAIETIMIDGIPFDLKLKLKKNDSGERIIRVRAIPVLEEQKIVKIQGVVQDISALID